MFLIMFGFMFGDMQRILSQNATETSSGSSGSTGMLGMTRTYFSTPEADDPNQSGEESEPSVKSIGTSAEQKALGAKLKPKLRKRRARLRGQHVKSL